MSVAAMELRAGGGSRHQRRQVESRDSVTRRENQSENSIITLSQSEVSRD